MPDNLPNLTVETTTPNYIINNPLLTERAKTEYVDLTDEEALALGKLYIVNDALMNYWLGEAGDAFLDMANGIEQDLTNMNVFTGNCSLAYSNVISNFKYSDFEAGDSINVDSTTGG